jgi:hypothetical protein
MNTRRRHCRLYWILATSLLCLTNLAWAEEPLPADAETAETAQQPSELEQKEALLEKQAALLAKQEILLKEKEALLNKDEALFEKKQAADKKADKQAETAEKKPLPWWERIRFIGDFRYRFEWIDEAGKDGRYRNRIRARFGPVVKVWDGLDVGIIVGTGNSDDPVSTNQTLGDALSTKPFWLDQAYIHWHPPQAKGFHLKAGKMKYAFHQVGKSELMWDPDLRPGGFEANYRRRFGQVEPFITSAGYWIEERKNESDTWLVGGQAGIKVSFLDDRVYFLVGAGQYYYTSLKGNEPLHYPDDGRGNTLNEFLVDDNETPDDDNDDVYRYEYDTGFNETETFLEVGGKIVRLPWSVFGSFVINTAAGDDNMGWLAGATLGKCKKALDFQFRYQYKLQQPDSVVGIMTDSDFIGGGTDGRGHEGNFSFQIVKGLKLGLTYFYNETPLSTLGRYQRGQLDILVKF